MSLFSEKQLEEILKDTLDQIKDMHSMDNATELPIESVAVVQAYINSREELLEGDESHADLADKAEKAVSHWKKTHHSKIIIDTGSKIKRTQVTLRISMSKLDRGLFSDISPRESQLLHATLDCLAYKENKYSSDLRFENVLREDLKKYDLYLADKNMDEKE